MATVFMKWLETSPEKYNRGIQLLTLGQLGKLRKTIAQKIVSPDSKILEIGCGTGELAILMAGKGAHVTAIDSSDGMLEIARKNIEKSGVEEQVELLHLNAVQIAEKYPENEFDAIVSSLVFSEFTDIDRIFVLQACRKLLKPEGRLIIVDEVIPTSLMNRFLYSIVRFPLVLLTWLLTRASTAPLENFENECSQVGFKVAVPESRLWDSLVLFEAVLDEQKESTSLPHGFLGRLEHKVTLKSILMEFFLLFFRILPPYPKVQPGLYAVGEPGTGSPVLVTGNFYLTVRRVVKVLDKKLDAWLLVADSGGINVWCAAGGGYLTADKVVSVVKSSGVETVVSHHSLILPQLAANGVDGWQIRQETGWGVHWGPVLAQDIPEYLSSKKKKNEKVRLVSFPLKDRLEMGMVVIGFYLLLLTIPIWLFWRSYFWFVMGFAVLLSLLYSVCLPWIPGRDGIGKGAFLAGLTVIGCLVWASLSNNWVFEYIWNWSIGLGFLAFFIGAEFQGMSPHMRGEQANWGIEGFVGLGVVLAYFIPKAAGIW